MLFFLHISSKLVLDYESISYLKNKCVIALSYSVMIFGESNFEIILNFNNKVHDLIYRNQYLILGILLLKFVANFKANDV
jgi:hypothetical protein